MKKFRWFNVEWPTSIRTLAKRIKARSFDSGAGHGFVIDRVRDDYLEARYVERISYKDVVTDPFGKELIFERVEFRQTSFRASSFPPGLELIDAPRSTQALMNRLSEVLDFQVAIVPATVDVLLWSNFLLRDEGVSSEVESLQIGSLEVEPGVIAKVLIKGDGDVRAACSSLTGDRKYKIEKIKLRIKSPCRASVVLSAVGSAAFSSEDSVEQLIHPLRSALVNSGRSSR
jgi:hypothetical protein